MGKFDGVLLASDFDNTILNTERPRRTGLPPFRPFHSGMWKPSAISWTTAAALP